MFLFLPAYKTTPAPGSARSAFTLIEMLSVTALMAVLLAPLCLVTNGSGDVTRAANEVAGLLETAAAYSRANNTYVWVGFFEEDASLAPGCSGTGRIVVSVVASKDGTRIVDPSGAGAGIDPGRLIQIGKLTRIERMHLSDVPSPANPDAAGEEDSWDGRPEVKTSYVTYRVGESSPNRTIFPFVYPVGNSQTPPQYKFVKTIRFGPDGEANLNSSYSLVPWIEIGLQPARGNAKDVRSTNLVAIQVSGVTGGVQIYRR